MGLRNYQKYALTIHAFQRYRERFKSNVSESKATNTVRGWLSQSKFLSDENKGCQSWFNEDNNIVVVVDTSNFQIITLYSTLNEYNRTPKKLSEPSIEEDKAHPTAEQIVSDLVRSKYRSVKTDYYSELGHLFIEYGDRLDKLSRTAKPLVFTEKEDEAEKLKSKIVAIEDEFSEVMRSLDQYIQK